MAHWALGLEGKEHKEDEVAVHPVEELLRHLRLGVDHSAADKDAHVLEGAPHREGKPQECAPPVERARGQPDEETTGKQTGENGSDVRISLSGAWADPMADP